VDPETKDNDADCICRTYKLIEILQQKYKFGYNSVLA